MIKNISGRLLEIRILRYVYDIQNYTNSFLHHPSIILTSVYISVPLEMQILTREHFNRWYRLAPYYISILLIEIPFQATCAATYLTVSYWLTGQPIETNRLIFFMIISIAASLTAQAWGFFIGATTPIKVSSSFDVCRCFLL